MIQIDYDLKNIIICALRYAIGRKTYVTFEVCEYIMKHLDLIDERVVTEEEGRNLGVKLCLPFIETSAKENKNCKDIFMDVAQRIYARKKRPRRVENNCCIIF